MGDMVKNFIPSFREIVNLFFIIVNAKSIRTIVICFASLYYYEGQSKKVARNLLNLFLLLLLLLLSAPGHFQTY